MKNTPPIKQGWLRVAIFFVLWVSLQVAFGTILKKWLLTDEDDSSVNNKILLTTLITHTFTFVLVYIFRKFLDQKSFKSLGFAWKGYQQHAWTGALAAVFILCGGSLALLLGNNLIFIGIDFSVSSLLLNILLMVLVAFGEELLVRGYMLNNLLETLPKWIALPVSAVIFAALHGGNSNVSWLGIVGVFMGGIVLGVNYIYTRNLWFGIFFHFAWNFLQGPVLGYPVSGLDTSTLFVQNIKGATWWTGGAFGFEASALCSLLILAVTIAIAVYYHKNLRALAVIQS